MKRALLALALVLAGWSGAAADEPSAVERLRRAYVAARDSGRLARLAGEHRLRSGALTERVRIVADADTLFIESTHTDPADQDTLFGAQQIETTRRVGATSTSPTWCRPSCGRSSSMKGRSAANGRR